jgi:hypothetical protein
MLIFSLVNGAIMKIAIVGAGWYGCHIGVSLKKMGVDVKIFDQQSDVFSQASSKNQNRLHLGFHYPRSYLTREQSRVGFQRFLSIYGEYCKPVLRNIYAVDNRRSLIDFETYIAIMKSAKLDFKEVDYPYHYFSNLDGFIETDERVVDFSGVSKYFKNILNGQLVLGGKVENSDIIESEKNVLVFNESFDYLINCTWGTFRPFDSVDIFYEPCISFLYAPQEENNFALTVMDGKFISLYPYNDSLYSLTSVRYTPLARCDHFDGCEEIIESLNDVTILDLRSKFENEILYYYPRFLEKFSYYSYYTSIKSKLNVLNDCRQTLVERKGREIFVMPGKIDTIFQAEDKVMKFLFGVCDE